MVNDFLEDEVSVQIQGHQIIAPQSDKGNTWKYIIPILLRSLNTVDGEEKSGELASWYGEVRSIFRIFS